MFKNNQAKTCPMLKKPCIGNECMWSTKISGQNPQTGAEFEEEGCAMAWLPMLLIENTKASHQTGAAVESFRNETVKSHQQLLAVSEFAAGVISHDR